MAEYARTYFGDDSDIPGHDAELTLNDGDEQDGPLDFSRVLEAMSSHYHEHYEALMRWPWKLFSRRWCYMIEASARQQQLDEEKRREEEWNRLRAEHDARMGGG